jgi:predicted anti-sigma-YlaC factor YlaD
MTCRDATDFLAAYLAHELAPDVESTFTHHLQLCSNCREFLVEYEQTITAGRTACANDATPVPEELVRAILSALKEA